MGSLTDHPCVFGNSLIGPRDANKKADVSLDLSTVISETLSLRAFDSLWYWLILGCGWTFATARVLGVPWDLVQRGWTSDTDGRAELDALIHLFANRVLALSDRAGVWILGLVSFIYTVLAVAGFVYQVQFAQAVLILAFPMSLMVPLNVSTAARIISQNLYADALRASLRQHRLWQHIIAAVSILISALWGIWQMLQGYAPI